MKISKISFKNIHSLRGEHHIDFLSGPLAESGLFAITGATGSGKSTLLDVITLALYNKVPRIGAISNSVIDDEGGIMTRNAKDCYAEVEYIVNQKTYRSHWSIERNRNNNLNDRKQEIIDLATGTILESGKTSVPQKNEALIGLNYDQFVKAIVLSQGQFSKLLQAKRDERNKLLEDITGAKDYRAIGAAVFKKYRTATEACKEQDIRLGEIELLSEEELTTLKTQEITLNQSKLTKKKTLDSLKLEIENQKGILKNQTLLNTIQTQEKALLQALDKFKKEELALNRHTKYVVHSKLIADFEQADKALKELKEELTTQKANQNTVLKEKNTLLEAAASLLNTALGPEDYVDGLTAFQKKVTVLKTEEELARAAAKLQEDQIKKLLLDINKDSERLKFDPHPANFMASMVPIEARINEFLKTTKINSEDEISARTGHLKEKEFQIQALKLVLTQYHSELKNKNSKEKELEASKTLVIKYSATLLNLESELSQLEKDLETLIQEEEARKKYQSLEAHRNALIEGDPCPLCGALDHPFATDRPIFDLKEAALKAKKDLLTTKRDLKTATQTNLQNEQSKVKTLTEDIKSMELSLEPKFSEAKTFCKSLQLENMPDEAALQDIEKQVAMESQMLEKVKKAFDLTTLLERLKQLADHWQKSTDLKVEKETNRKALYAGDAIDDTVQSLLSKWSATLQNIGNAKRSITTLETKIAASAKEKEGFESQLQQILKTESIESLGQLKVFILSETAAEQIREKKKQLDLDQERLNTEKKNVLQALEQHQKAISSSEPLETLQTNFQKMEEEFGSLGETIGIIKNKLQADELARKKKAALLNVQAGLKKEEALWKTMNALIGDAHGKRFSNFVQDLTLEQLIGYANLRLKDLSDRYTLDWPTADEAYKNDSLKVFDSHQGDVRRSINTLSGGETFMVSLAMAFALSDLAAKNVKIESIFIDEGFGTLDPDTLNQAISILEKMQNEGDKSIGVISHVEALKDRITTQIRLEKMGSGYSTIEII